MTRTGILVSSCVVVFVGGLLGLNVIRHEGYTFRELITIVIIPHTLHYYLRLNFIYAARYILTMYTVIYKH